MQRTEINFTNRRVSPGGLITLPAMAGKMLGTRRAGGGRVTVVVKGDTVELLPGREGASTARVSLGGLLQLPSEAHAALTGREKGRYRCELEEGRALLRRV